MVIWVGDPNLLYTLLVFLAVFFLCTHGDRVGRLTMCLVFFLSGDVRMRVAGHLSTVLAVL